MLSLAQIIEDHLKKDRPFVAIPKPKNGGVRKSKNPVDWANVDYHVFKATLMNSFAGCDIGKFIHSCPTFVRKNDAANRAIINKSLDSLVQRGLVKVTGHGRDRYIKAANGASLASYYGRGECPITRPDVFRRTTVKEEISPIPTEIIIEDSEDSDFDDSDYENLDDDLSVE
jgi:hypothetical protein